MASTESVVKYFLYIFRLQAEFAENQALKSQFRLVAEEAGGDQVFELQAGRADQWRTRRMSIRQLGESVESKSTCYKVVFDELLVVKIPPRAFSDFDTYLRYIRTEESIARQLTPAITCLYPSISGILKKIPQLRPAGRPGPETDADYIRLLSTQPELQKYLKIGGRLAFFMDLSRYMFLNQVLGAIHEKKERTLSAIMKNRSAFLDLDAFETIYGAGHEDLFFAANHLYRSYQRQMDIVTTHTEGIVSIPNYLREEWFFEQLAGRRPDIPASGYSAAAAQNIQHALTSVTKTYQPTISRYRQLVSRHVDKKAFHANHSKMAGLIANTTALISRLKMQGTAIRDLKPDNIFIEINFDGADHLLGDPASYDLGLIDLETAVSLLKDRPEDLEQPLMAGTPAFMTPSQLFSNPVLLELFGPYTGRILYMQDWYAAVGIIYNIVTGEHLFSRTAKLIPEIVRIRKTGGRDPGKIFQQVSWNFWHTASMELAEKIRASGDRFHALRVPVPDEARKSFADEALQENALLKKTLHHMVTNQDLFPNSRQRLLSATAESVRRNRLRYVKRLAAAKDHSARDTRILDFLHTLEALKAQIQKNSSLINMKTDPLTAARLMNLLFYRAFFAMYDPCWSERPLPAAEVELAGESAGTTPRDRA
ncbi:MAG: hypothetical protein R6X08_00605 [Desulfosalsimonadaceae bacterium]